MTNEKIVYLIKYFPFEYFYRPLCHKLITNKKILIVTKTIRNYAACKIVTKCKKILKYMSVLNKVIYNDYKFKQNLHVYHPTYTVIILKYKSIKTKI